MRWAAGSVSAAARSAPNRRILPDFSSPLLTAVASPSEPTAPLPIETFSEWSQFPADAPAEGSLVHAPCTTPRDAREDFFSLLKNSWRSAKSMAEVEVIHSRAVKIGFSQDAQVGSHLIRLYGKGGRLESARKLFGEMPYRDTIMWTVLITGFSATRLYPEVLGLFVQMLSAGVFPSCATLVSAFKCYKSIRHLNGGRGIHGWILRNGVRSDVILENSIVDFYAKCGNFDYAKRVFHRMAERDIVSWNIMIGANFQTGNIHGSFELFKMMPFQDAIGWNIVINGLMQNGFYRMALALLYKMVMVGQLFTCFTFSMALALVGTLSLPELGRQLHGKLLRSEADIDGFIRNTLIDMYCKCGNMESASIVFSKVPCSTKKLQMSAVYKDGNAVETISWSSMIAGYINSGRYEEALNLFHRMFHEFVILDSFTLTSIVAACAYVGYLAQGRQIHACVEKLGHGSDVYLSSAITDMYGKCGSLEDAHIVFEKAENRNVVLWTSMIGAYGSHGQGRKAVQTFEMMLDNKIVPNEISFVGVLSGCSHAGLIREGYKYFNSMKEDFGLAPSVEHFTCMVDLLGRAGLIQEARDFIYENDIAKSSAAWKALLSACRFHRNMDMAKCASEQLVQLEPFDAGSFILLSNIYSTTSQWADASKVRSMMKERRVMKQPGVSWIQLKNKIHTFIAGDRSHPQMDHIYSYLNELILRLKEMGYQSEISEALHDVEVEEREFLLRYHSEKLAVACGIINTPCGSPIRVMKNLRICGDCHMAIKYISVATNREIMLRDAHRFHHFKHGKCSCGDYW